MRFARFWVADYWEENRYEKHWYFICSGCRPFIELKFFFNGSGDQNYRKHR